MASETRKLLAMPWRDGVLLAESILILAAMRISLCFFRYPTVLARLPAAQTPPADAFAQRLAIAIRRAAFLFPDGSCLRQALAGYYMLGRRGWASSIEVGVALDKNRQFDAHAWLISGNRIITGGTRETLQRYAVFRDRDSQSL